VLLKFIVRVSFYFQEGKNNWCVTSTHTCILKLNIHRRKKRFQQTL